MLRYSNGTMCMLILAGVIGIAAGLGASSAMGQTVWYVDDDAVGAGDGSSWQDAFVDLQAALDVASNGHEIRVAGGTYYPSRQYDSEDPRSACFQLKNGVALRGGYAGLADPFAQDVRDFEVYESVLSGDLNGDDGPVLLQVFMECYSGRDNPLSPGCEEYDLDGDNDVDWYDPTDFLADNHYTDNCRNVFYHPEDLALDSSAILEGFTITGAVDRDSNGGMVNEVCSPTIVDCQFTGNLGEYAGAMHNSQATPTITRCSFVGNCADMGGGITNTSSAATLRSCAFHHNHATEVGGAVLDDASGTIFANCVFESNSARNGGGATTHYACDSQIVNCTFSANWSEWGNSVVQCSGGNLSIFNSILAAINASAIQQLCVTGYSGGLASCVVSYSAVEGGLGNVYVNEYATLTWGEGNMDGDPQLLADRLHLRPESPCVDAGSNGLVPSYVIYDMDEEDRIIHCRVDIGADESPVLVDCNSNGLPDRCDIYDLISDDCNENGVPDECEPNGLLDCDGNGITDWCDVQAGIDLDCNENYVLDECESGSAVDCNSNAIADWCDIHNGNTEDCNTNWIPDICEQDFPRVVYVDDDAAPGGDGFSWDSAFRSIDEAMDATLCSSLTTEVHVAGGVYYPSRLHDAEDPRTACFQLRNSLALRGGYAGLADPVAPDARNFEIYESILSGDLNRDDGPLFIEDFIGCCEGIRLPLDGGCTPSDVDFDEDGDVDSEDLRLFLGANNYGDNATNIFYHPEVLAIDDTAVLDGFTMTGATSAYDYGYGGNSGGGMHNESASPTIVNCTFTSNVSWDAGALYNLDHSSPTITDSAFHRNVSAYRGGAIRNYYYSNAEILNCRISENLALGTGYGGGLSNSSYSDCRIIGCTFYRNSASGGGAIHNDSVGGTIINCLFNANSARRGGVGGGVYTMATGLEVGNCSFVNNYASNGSSMYVFDGSSQYPVRISNSVFWSYWMEFDNQIYVINPYVAVVENCWIQDEENQDPWEYVRNGPRFVDPIGPDEIVGTMDDDYRLQPSSPCIDAGDDDSVPAGIEVDLDGAARFVDGDADGLDTVDMGAYEYQADCNTNGIHDGQEIAEGTASDCNTNGFPDQCDNITPGDFDADGMVSIGDFAALPDCLAGPVETPSPADPRCQMVCVEAFDFDGNGMVDLRDFAEFQAAIRP